MSERELKGYRARRRRIGSLFGGKDNLQHVAVTIGSRTTARGVLCGVSMQVSGTARKGLKATEGYSLPAVASKDPALCLIRALIEIYLLDLDDVRAEVFVMTPESLDLARRLFEDRADNAGRPPLRQGLRNLLRGLPRLALHPCVKGPFFEAMERKLADLSSHQTNEVTVVDFTALAGRVLKEDGGSP